MKTCFALFCNTVCLMAVGLTAALVSCPASAQSILHPQTQEKLAARVRLAPGATTLADVLASLSAQTKLDIQAAPYLNAHNLTLQIEDASGLDVLNTLAELNGWRWYEREDKSIVVARPRVTAPPQIAGIPAMLQAAIPLDLRRYEDVTETSFADTPSARQASASMVYDSNRDRQLFHLGDEIARLLPNIRNGKPVPYAKLTPKQQRILLFFAFLANGTGGKDVMAQDTIKGDFDSYELDPTLCQIYIKQEKFMYIGREIVNGTTRTSSGFGAPIDYGTRMEASRKKRPQ